MRKTSLIISAAAGLALAQAARADQLLYEPFNYPASPNPTSWSNGHNGSEVDELGVNWPTNAGDTVPTWIDYYNGNPNPYVGSGNLTYPGLLNLNPNSNDITYHGTTTGGSLSDAYYWFGQPTGAWNGSSQPPFTTYQQNPTTSTTLYYSVLLRVNQVGQAGETFTGANGTSDQSSDGWRTGTTPAQQLFMGFMDTTTYTNQTAIGGTAGGLLIKSGDGTQYGTTYQLGLGGGTTTSTANYPTNGTTYGLGQTLLVVVAYTMNPDPTTNVAKMYINPTPGSLESANTAVVQTATPAAVTGALTGFFLKESASLPDYGLEADELRVGTTWGNVAAWATPGDANDNGTVNSDDFDILAANFGKTSGMNWNTGDFNNDGIVNALDFNALATNWGSNVTGAAPAGALGSVVPEPASALLLICGASPLLAGRRRRMGRRLGRRMA